MSLGNNIEFREKDVLVVTQGLDGKLRYSDKKQVGNLQIESCLRIAYP